MQLALEAKIFLTKTFQNIPLPALPEQSTIHIATLNHDASKAAFLGTEGKLIEITRSTDKAHERTLSFPITPNPTQQLFYNRDGNKLFIAHHQSIYEVKGNDDSSQLVITLPHPISQLDITPDSQSLVARSASPSTTNISIIDVASHTETHKQQIPNKALWHAIAKNSGAIYLIFADGTFATLPLEEGVLSPIATMGKISTPFTAAHYDDEAQQIYTCHHTKGSGLNIYDPMSGKLLWSAPESLVGAIAIHPISANQIVTLGSDMCLRRWSKNPNLRR